MSVVGVSDGGSGGGERWLRVMVMGEGEDDVEECD